MQSMGEGVSRCGCSLWGGEWMWMQSIGVSGCGCSLWR